MRDNWGEIGEQAAKQIVRDNLRFWKNGNKFTPEDQLSLAWCDRQPWLVKLEGEPLQALKKLVSLGKLPDEQLPAVYESIGIVAKWTLIRLLIEGRLDVAAKRVRHQEAFGPVGDVLDLGWTKEAELALWIDASTTSWSAFEGVRRLRRRLICFDQPVPDALNTWDREVLTGTRKRPTLGHRPTSETYRNRAIVLVIRHLTVTPEERKAGIRKVKRDTAFRLVSDELNLRLETVRDIWYEGHGKVGRNPWIFAPTLRPFVQIRSNLNPKFLELLGL